MTGTKRGRIRFGEFVLDLDAGALYRAGLALKLQPQPFEVLAALLEQPGSLLTREALRERIWQSNTFIDFNHSLNIAINKLRAAMDDSAEQPRFIETVPRRGYRFIAVVEQPEPAPVVAGRVPRPIEPTRPGRWSRGIAMGAGAAVAIALVIAAAVLSRPAKTPKGSAGLIRSIAVLPLDDVSAGGSVDPYFADSMTDELATALARLPDLSVISRSSVLSLRGRDHAVSDAAATLGVDAIVQGTIMHSGSRLRVTARLTETAGGRELWTGVFEREMREVLALQRGVTIDIASAIGRQVVAASPDAIVDPGAFDAYLRGRFAWNARTEAGLRQAIAEFVRANQLDPGYAPAYAGLADCYATLGYLSNIAPGDGFPAARAAAERALQLDDSLADAHASLAYVHMYYDWDWAGAEREFRRALVLNPSSAITYQWYAVFLTARMRPGEARDAIERARSLDPLSPAIATDVGFQLYYTRQYDAAVVQLKGVLASAPQFPLAHLWLGRAYQQQNLLGEAIAEFQAAEGGLPDWPVTVAAIGSAQGSAGDPHAARQTLKRLETLGKRRYVTPYAYALVHSALGNPDRAMTWLERGVEERTPWMVWMTLDPRWGALAARPAFRRLALRIGPSS